MKFRVVSLLILIVFLFQPLHAIAAIFYASQNGAWSSARTWLEAPVMLQPIDVVQDGSGNIFVADYEGNTIDKISAATNALTATYDLDGELSNPISITYHSGALFIADRGNNRIVKMNSDTGAFIAEYTGNGAIEELTGVAVDSSGYIYVSEGPVGVLKINPADDTVLATYDAEGTLGNGAGVAVASNGHIFIVDQNNAQVVEVDPADDTVVRVYTGEGQLSNAIDAVFDSHGDLFVVSNGNSAIVKVRTTDDTVERIYSAHESLASPTGVTIDPEGNLLVADINNGVVMKISAADDNSFRVYDGNGPATEGVNYPGPQDDVIFYPGGNHPVVEMTADHAVRNLELGEQGTLDLKGHTLSISGNWKNSGGILRNNGGTIDFNGGNQSIAGRNIFENIIKRVSSAATLSFDTSALTAISRSIQFKGSVNNLLHLKANTTGSKPSFLRKFGTSTTDTTMWSSPYDVAFGANGNAYVSDAQNDRVVEIDPITKKKVAVFTAGGTLDGPGSIDFDSSGNLLIADYSNNRVVKINPSTDTVLMEYTAENSLGSVSGVAVDDSNNLYIADTGNSRIVKVNGADDTVLAEYNAGSSLSNPYNVILDGAGKLLVADGANARVIKIDPADDSIMAEYTGEGAFSLPYDMTVDGDGNIFVGDPGTQSVYKINPLTDEVLVTYSYSTANISGVALGPNGYLYVADQSNNEVIVGDATSLVSLIVERILGFVPDVGQYVFPAGVARDNDGNVYVSDCAENTSARIEKYDSQGNYLATFGSYGNGSGQYQCPGRIKIGADNFLYVSDVDNDRIEKLNPSNGNVVATFTGNGEIENAYFFDIDADGYLYTSDQNQGVILKINPADDTVVGHYNGTFEITDPAGVAVGDDGFIYVVDSGNENVVKLNPVDDTVVATYDFNGDINVLGDIVIDAEGGFYVTDPVNSVLYKVDLASNTILYSLDGTESGEEEFADLEQVFIATDGTLYVVSGGTAEIKVYAPLVSWQIKLDSEYSAPSFVETRGVPSNSDGFAQIAGIATDNAGNTFVVENNTSKILKVNAAGSIIQTIGSEGAGDGQFQNATGIDVDDAGNIYVVDAGNSRIVKLNAAGNFQKTWGWGVRDGASEFQICTSNCLQGIPGIDEEQISNPTAVQVSPSQHVFVTDGGRSQVIEYTEDGAYVGVYGQNGFGDGEFGSPGGIAFDSAGNAYVTDPDNNRVQKFDADFNYVSQWGVSGTAESEFNSPRGITIDSSGNVVVTESGNMRVQVFTSAGDFVRMWGWGVQDGSNEFQICTSGCQEGLQGDARGQFTAPYVVDLDSNNRLVVGDGNNFKIFTTTGNVVSENFGTQVKGGVFDGVFGITNDTDGNIYASDCGSGVFNHVTKFDADGNALLTIGRSGSGNGEFDCPEGLTAYKEGGTTYLYVVDTGNNRVQKFTADGVFVSQFGSSGTAEGEFAEPTDVAVGLSGNVFITESGNDRIQEFSPSGSFIKMWGWGVQNGDDEFQICTSGCQEGNNGTDDGQFSGLTGIALDSAGSIYVSDFNRNDIQKFDQDGRFISSFGGEGEEDGEFNGPSGVVFDAQGNIYVADQDNHRIQKFTSGGDFITQWGHEGSADGEFDTPIELAIHDGRIYVVDEANYRIQVFQNQGQLSSALTALSYLDVTNSQNLSSFSFPCFDGCRDGGGNNNWSFNPSSNGSQSYTIGSSGSGNQSPVISPATPGKPESTPPSPIGESPKPPIAFPLYRDLTIGTLGDDSKWLQVFLNTHGFIVSPEGPGSPGNETNKFGAQTTKALARFQKANGIVPASGNLGPLTRSVIALLVGQKPETLTEQSPVDSFGYTRDLQVGSKGNDVKALQVFLNAHGFVIALSGPGSPGQETTLFGALTAQALVRFQKASGITPASGYFGPKTREYIGRLQ